MNADILQSLIELFQKKQYTKVLEIAAPIVDQNPVYQDAQLARPDIFALPLLNFCLMHMAFC